MKYLYYAIFAAVIFAAGGCKKEKNPEPKDETQISDTTGNGGVNPRYYFRFKFDGVQKEYKLLGDNAYQAFLDLKDNEGTYTSFITGLGDGQSTKKSAITCLINSGKSPLKTGITYTDFTTNEAGFLKIPTLQFVLFDEKGIGFASWDDTTENVISNTRLKITELTETYVRGTFSAEVYPDLSDTKSNHKITDGVFFCKNVPTK